MEWMVRRQVVVGPWLELFDGWLREGWEGGRNITHRLFRGWGKGRAKLLYLGQRCEPATLMLQQGRSRGG